MNFEQSNATIQLLSRTYMSEADAGLLGWLIGIIAVPAALVLLFFLARFVYCFSMELRYLNVEIERTEGEECRHYMRRRRRLWLSLIPFVRY